MSVLTRAPQSTRFEWSRWPFLLAGIGLATLCAFLLMPGSIASKTHLALHGICAQRPSHSLYLGDAALPLDARMTGMYIGAAAAAIWLVVTGKVRNTRVPPRHSLAVLALFVVFLAVDGLNALAVDLRLPHPYDPSNRLRLLTGILGGTAMGVALLHLLATTMWARGDRTRSLITGPEELVVPVGIALAIGALALSGLPILYAPLAVGLLITAVGVFAALTTIALALMAGRGWTYSSYREMAGLACGGLSTALVLIAALSGLRLLLESWFGLPKLT